MDHLKFTKLKGPSDLLKMKFYFSFYNEFLGQIILNMECFGIDFSRFPDTVKKTRISQRDRVLYRGCFSGKAVRSETQTVRQSSCPELR